MSTHKQVARLNNMVSEILVKELLRNTITIVRTDDPNYFLSQFLSHDGSPKNFTFVTGPVCLPKISKPYFAALDVEYFTSPDPTNELDTIKTQEALDNLAKMIVNPEKLLLNIVNPELSAKIGFSHHPAVSKSVLPNDKGQSVPTGVFNIVVPYADTMLNNPVNAHRLHELFGVLRRKFTAANLILTVHPEFKLNNYIDAFPVIDYTPSLSELLEDYSGIIENSNEKGKTLYGVDDPKKFVESMISTTIGCHRFTRTGSIKSVAHDVKQELGLDNVEGRDKVIRMLNHAQSKELAKVKGLKSLEATSLSEIGGLGAFKNWLSDWSQSLTEEAIEYGVKPVKGMMLVGPAGCGKSRIVGCVADAFKLPLIEMNISEMLDMYVGNSEVNMSKALNTLDRVKPCVVKVDEIDKLFSDSTGPGDNGVMSRVLSPLLTFMQEQSGVVFVFTANRVANLPAELVRAGRLDVIFGFDLPNTQERQQIVELYINKGGFSTKPENVKLFTNSTEGFSGAELEVAVNNAKNAQFKKDKSKVLDVESLVNAAKNLVPQSRSYQDQLNMMREWITRNAISGNSQVETKLEI